MWAGQFAGLVCSGEMSDELKKWLWRVVERWIEELILTLGGQSQLLFQMCTWNISGVFFFLVHTEAKYF